MRPFRDLIVWQRAHALVLDVYRESLGFPKHELFGLTSQMRRSAASIPYNIVEGSVFDDGKQFRRYLGLALASSAELEYQLILARDLRYLTPDQYAALDAPLAEVKRMLVAFRRRLSDDETKS
jgi:four helix bundle protein